MFNGDKSLILITNGVILAKPSKAIPPLKETQKEGRKSKEYG